MREATNRSSSSATRASILGRQRGRGTAGIIVALLAMTIGSCGGPSIAPTASVDLSGTWSGVVGSGSGGGRALRLTWSATQTGNTVLGPATLTTSPAVSALSFAGTLSGSLTGLQLSLSYASNAGSNTGAPDCCDSGHGTGTTFGTSISGQLDVAVTSCDALGLQAPTRDQFTLTKQ